MSRIKYLGWSAVLLALVASAIALNNFGEKSPLIASGSVHIEASLEEQAVGLRTLYITVFDQNSPMPMPFGAMKEKLPKVGQQVSTSMGDASVIGSNPLKETVLVELENEVRVELPLSEVSY